MDINDPLARSAMDDIVQDILDAWAEARELHIKTRNADARRAARRIVSTLRPALEKLAPLGIHSERRLANEVGKISN